MALLAGFIHRFERGGQGRAIGRCGLRCRLQAAAQLLGEIVERLRRIGEGGRDIRRDHLHMLQLVEIGGRFAALSLYGLLQLLAGTDCARSARSW